MSLDMEIIITAQFIILLHKLFKQKNSIQGKKQSKKFNYAADAQVKLPIKKLNM
jgi:hypothetical protein